MKRHKTRVRLSRETIHRLALSGARGGMPNGSNYGCCTNEMSGCPAPDTRRRDGSECRCATQYGQGSKIACCA